MLVRRTDNRLGITKSNAFHDDYELFTTPAPYEMRMAGLDEIQCDRLQHPIAHQVAVPVVNGLEVVYVANSQGVDILSAKPGKLIRQATPI